MDMQERNKKCDCAIGVAIIGAEPVNDENGHTYSVCLAIIDLVLAHPVIKKTPELDAGVSAVRDFVADLWNSSEELA